MATVTERSPGVWMARVFLPPTTGGGGGRQVGKVFRGSKKAVKAAIADWERELRGTTPATVGATIADLLRLWLDAKRGDWQPTSARDYAGRCRAITGAIGSVRLVDLDPLLIDAWIADMRKAGVG